MSEKCLDGSSEIKEAQDGHCDVDGVSHVRKTKSRQVQWGAVPRVVFEVRTPGEVPLYLIGDRLGGYYTRALPEDLPSPGLPLGL